MAPRKGKKKATEEVSGSVIIPPIVGPGVMPRVVATLDMDDTVNLAKNYTTCIANIITAMSVGTVVFTVPPGARGADDESPTLVPITPPISSSAEGAYAIRLLSAGKELLVVAEKYQTWFRGIITKDGRRYELEDICHMPKMMVGSNSLHTDGMYPRLVGGAHKCWIGYQSLLTGFHAMERYVGQTDIEHEKAIATILVMFFEAPRFEQVYQTSLLLLQEGRDQQVGATLKNMINDWYDDSLAFFKVQGEETSVSVQAAMANAAVAKMAYNIRILCRSAWDSWLQETQVQAGGSRKNRN